MTGGNRRTHTYMTGVHIPDWRTHIYIYTHVQVVCNYIENFGMYFGLLRILT